MKLILKKQTKGQTLVEFTVVLSLFLFLIFVVVDLGRAVFFYSSIQNAAREGARYGIINPSDTAGIKSEALRLAPFLENVHIQEPTELNNKITIQINYPFEGATPLLSLLTGEPNLVLHGQATMWIEN